MTSMSKVIESWFPGWWCVCGVFGLISVIALDQFLWFPTSFSEQPPILTLDFAFRSLLYGGFSAFILVATTNHYRRRFGKVATKVFCHPTASILLVATMSLGAVCLVLLSGFPDTYNSLWKEDGIVEWASALLLFICSAVLMSSMMLVLGKREPLVASGLGVLALVFFVIGMEEVSWFQRVLEIETPESFGANYQGEMNLHNFATDYVENVYYFGAFCFLVALPYLAIVCRPIQSMPRIHLFIGSPYVIAVSSLAFALNYDMWNILFTQVAFFGTATTLVLLFSATSFRLDRLLIGLSLVMLLVSQVCYLMSGDVYDGIWAITEYKELFIPIGFLAYSLSCLSNCRSWVSTPQPLTQFAGC